MAHGFLHDLPHSKGVSFAPGTQAAALELAFFVSVGIERLTAKSRTANSTTFFFVMPSLIAMRVTSSWVVRSLQIGACFLVTGALST